MSRRPERPDRPLLPPALWALVAAVALCRLTLAAGPDPAACVRLAVGLVAVTCAAALLARRGRLRTVVPLAVAVGASLTCASLACAAELAAQGAVAGELSSSPVSAHELALEGDMSEGASGWRGRARLVGGAGSVWLVADEPIEAGSTVRCVGRFSPNEENEWGATSRAQGLAGTVRVVRVLSSSPPRGPLGAVLGLRARVLESLDAASSDARALVAGSVCGSTRAMSERGLDELFARCGVSHLVAVSGGHLVLVTALVGLALRRAPLRPVARSVALLLSTGLLVLFCGAPVSAVRSWGMSLVAELSGLVGRRSHPLSSASVVALSLALADPGVTGQLGYLLSVACVCGICALGPYVNYVLRVIGARPSAAPRRGRVRSALRRAGSDAREALALTLVSQAVTVPMTCAAFGSLSLVAPLANVLLAPLFSALLTLGLTAALLVGVPAAQAVALLGCEAVGGALMVVLRSLAGLPGACVAVDVEEGPALLALAVALAALLVAWPRVTRRALLGVACALVLAGACWHVRWRCFAPACVRVLDVGQGDAILLTDGAAAVLVDTGPDDAVVSALARCNVGHLDAVVLTHLHSDHAGGLEDLLGVVDVDRLVVPELTEVPEAAAGLPVDEAGYGDLLRAGGFTMRVVSPVEPAAGEGNEGSLELLVSYDVDGRELTALLAADAEREETGAAVEREDVGDVDLLKVGHHGSEASLTPEIAAALAPEVSVASAGEGNSYGHPDPVCVGMLEDVGSLVLCTKDVGDVCVEPGAEGPVVSCQRGGAS
ncbi:ComEC/Rec2 family competence protein [Olsenella uli]|uniref:ComEC/Rec2 family competence protein n=1 Tax=Olsenella uli TaxID=133926 RepID=UPI00195C4CDA|nr:ComEC/Rec2 family competence protein [Olsenella uli]